MKVSNRALGRDVWLDVQISGCCEQASGHRLDESWDFVADFDGAAADASWTMSNVPRT